MKVLKFGGPSIDTPERLEKVIGLLRDSIDGGENPVVVVSSFSDMTNCLIELGELAADRNEEYLVKFELLKSRHYSYVKKVCSGDFLLKVEKFLDERFAELADLLHGVFLVREMSLKTQDLIMSFGEILMAFILTQVFCENLISSFYADAREFVRTNDEFGVAAIDFEKTRNQLIDFLAGKSGLPVITGFIGATEDGVTTTIGRNGSDYTAAIVGAVLEVDEIEIWGDVDGLMTADPRKVSNAFPIAQMTYEEALEMSHFGAAVLYPPSIKPAMKSGIPIRIRNSLNMNFPGTLIDNNFNQENLEIRGISSMSGISVLRLRSSALRENGIKFQERVFRALAKLRAKIIPLSQASAQGVLVLAVPTKLVKQIQKLLHEEFSMESNLGILEEISVESGFSMVAIVGTQVKESTDIALKLFGALKKSNSNVVALMHGPNDLNISFLIDEKKELAVLSALHDVFFFANC
jgi:aspartokinase/homoserine dehydrogenase 1